MTKHYEDIHKVSRELSFISCDCCKKQFNIDEHIFEIQDMIHIEHLGGYGSLFGDGVKVSADFCARCSNTLFGNFLTKEVVF